MGIRLDFLHNRGGLNFVHNLNLSNPIMANYYLYLKCKSETDGFITGDILSIPPSVYCNNNTVGISMLIKSNSVSFTLGSQYALFITNKAGTSFISTANVINGFDICLKIVY